MIGMPADIMRFCGAMKQLMKILYFAMRSDKQLAPSKLQRGAEDVSELMAPEGSVSANELPGSLSTAAKEGAAVAQQVESVAQGPSEVPLTGEAAEDAGDVDTYMDEKDDVDADGGGLGEADDDDGPDSPAPRPEAGLASAREPLLDR